MLSKLREKLFPKKESPEKSPMESGNDDLLHKLKLLEEQRKKREAEEAARSKRNLDTTNKLLGQMQDKIKETDRVQDETMRLGMINPKGKS